jgi:hypothetical protein
LRVGEWIHHKLSGLSKQNEQAVTTAAKAKTKATAAAAVAAAGSRPDAAAPSAASIANALVDTVPNVATSSSDDANDNDASENAEYGSGPNSAGTSVTTTPEYMQCFQSITATSATKKAACTASDAAIAASAKPAVDVSPRNKLELQKAAIVAQLHCSKSRKAWDATMIACTNVMQQAQAETRAAELSAAASSGTLAPAQIGRRANSQRQSNKSASSIAASKAMYMAGKLDRAFSKSANLYESCLVRERTAAVAAAATDHSGEGGRNRRDDGGRGGDDRGNGGKDVETGEIETKCALERGRAFAGGVVELNVLNLCKVSVIAFC